MFALCIAAVLSARRKCERGWQILQFYYEWSAICTRQHEQLAYMIASLLHHGTCLPHSSKLAVLTRLLRELNSSEVSRTARQNKNRKHFFPVLMILYSV